MGSEGPSVVTVHVTGFKKFHGVAENPTEKIVSNLRSFMEKRGLPKNLVLGSCTVLETAGQGALGTLYKVLESAIADRENGSSAQGQVIWIHFGVNSGATRFALENQAVNEATFRCPDELGWKPQRVPIVPSDGSISRTREFAGCWFSTHGMKYGLMNHDAYRQEIWRVLAIFWENLFDFQNNENWSSGDETEVLTNTRSSLC